MALRYQRVLLKLSGEALAGSKEYGIDGAVAEFVAREIKDVTSAGAQLGIVIGGGNIFRGASGSLSAVSRTAGDAIGMLATCINSLALQSFLLKAGVDTTVYGALAVEKTLRPFVSSDARADLDAGRTVIIAGGTGNPFFTTDTAAALRCAEIGGQALLKATKVDGVYSDDPVKVPAARKFASITYAEAIERRLRVMDLTALAFCMENNVPIIVFKLMEPGSLRKCLEGAAVGSIVTKEA